MLIDKIFMSFHVSKQTVNVMPEPLRNCRCVWVVPGHSQYSNDANVNVAWHAHTRNELIRPRPAVQSMIQLRTPNSPDYESLIAFVGNGRHD